MPGAKRRDPIRLTRQSGHWSIEFTRLVAVDDHLMRPERRRVAATSDALRSLSQSCPPERIREAEVLIGQSDDGSERVFELAEDGWAPAPVVRHSQRPLARTELMQLVASLEAQMLGLRALCDSLLARVVTLEGQALERRRSEPEPRYVRKVPSRRDVLLSLQNGASEANSAVNVLGPTRAEPAPDLSAAPPAASAPAPPPAPRVVDVAPVTQASAEGLAPPGPPRIALPSSSEVIACLEMLAADVKVKADSAPMPSDLATFSLARLADEAGDIVGFLLVDQRAGAELGGGLLGLPQMARDDQAQRGLDKDTQEALNEIMNNLGGLVNRANPKCYTRLQGLEPASLVVELDAANPAKKLGLSTGGGGRLLFASR
jgi:hypothetical protein